MYHNANKTFRTVHKICLLTFSRVKRIVSKQYGYTTIQIRTVQFPINQIKKNQRTLTQKVMYIEKKYYMPY